MTPLTTAAAATRVIRSPPGSQLERNRAFWRMISASVMQLSDAHHDHRRNIRRSASVTRSPATAPRRASSASSSDTDAGAADDDDYELEERSAGTPMRRSATSSTCLGRSRQQQPPAMRLSKTTRTTRTAVANCAAHCVSPTPTAASSWLRQTQASKPASRGNGHRLHATAKTSNCRLGSRTSQPESFGPSRWFSPNLQHRPPSLR